MHAPPRKVLENGSAAMLCRPPLPICQIERGLALSALSIETAIPVEVRGKALLIDVAGKEQANHKAASVSQNGAMRIDRRCETAP